MDPGPLSSHRPTVQFRAGQSLAHYEIQGVLGSGAMGEVYRARDTKLGREVAIKVLPEAFASDEERLRRFEREARTLASLNHPSVAQIYDVDQVGETCFLALELVPGETLEERIARGRLPIAEAIDVCRQIAEGLEAAHEAGVIHRDLKPANVRITPDGKVKILDFGLAKPARESGSGSSTDSVLSTEAGRLLGTPTYMAPEQARGKPIDRRVDIWAFGCVLYECLTAKRAFAGETISDVLAAVLDREPDWSRIPAGTPGGVRALLGRCLVKDPKQRLRDIGEARWALERPAGGSEATPETRRSTWLLVAALALGSSGVAYGLLARRHAANGPVVPAIRPVSFEFAVEGHVLSRGSMAVSPEGTDLAFLVDTGDGESELWLRSFRDPSAHAIQGTRGARQPFWSPDGKEIGFFAGRQLRRVALDGTTPRTIAEVGRTFGGTWGPDGTILFGTDTGPIRRVPAAGGSAPVPVTAITDAREIAHVWPTFLPDGRHFLYLSDASTIEDHRLCIGSLGGEPPVVLRTGVRAQPVLDARGAVLLAQGGQLLAHPLDLADPRTLGEGVLAADRVFASGPFHETPAGVSASGVLAYQEGSTDSAAVLVDPLGKEQRILVPPASQRDPALSPDGRRLALDSLSDSGENAVWILDLERGVRTLVSERGVQADSPVWSADGRRLYFDQSAKEGWELWRRTLDESVPAEDLGRPDGVREMWTLDVTPDERFALIEANVGDRPTIFVRDLSVSSGGWSVWSTADAGVLMQYAKLSPDGRFVAYDSDRSGRLEVYVAPFEGGPAKRTLQISSDGGREPRWNADGSKLYFRSAVDRLTVVPITVQEDRVQAGSPAELFALDPLWSYSWRNSFDVLPDGRGFVVLRLERPGARTIHVRTGWGG